MGRILFPKGKQGIGIGDKIKRQVDFPPWIWKKASYQTACVRGLIDTDGGVYFHHHTVKEKRYRNFGLCFTSCSKPLLDSVSRVFTSFEIKHSKLKTTIYLYSLNHVKRYFEIFGSSNPKHLGRLKYHLANKTRLS